MQFEYRFPCKYPSIARLHASTIHLSINTLNTFQFPLHWHKLHFQGWFRGYLLCLMCIVHWGIKICLTILCSLGATTSSQAANTYPMTVVFLVIIHFVYYICLVFWQLQWLLYFFNWHSPHFKGKKSSFQVIIHLVYYVYIYFPYTDIKNTYITGPKMKFIPIVLSKHPLGGLYTGNSSSNF